VTATVFRTEVEVFTFDIDFAGHVSNIAYIRWLEMTRVRLLDAVGLPIDDLVASGVAPIIAGTEISYLRPIRLREPVEIELWLSELRAASATMRFDVRAGAERQIAARASQRGLFVRLDTGRPARMPAETRSALAAYRLDRD
jgi:acyl-CoA thioester hydrolase